MPYYKYEPQSVLENSICKQYCDKSVTADSLDILVVILDKTNDEAYTTEWQFVTVTTVTAPSPRSNRSIQTCKKN